MKTGYYVRFIPLENEFSFYFFDGLSLFALCRPHIWYLGDSVKEYLNKYVVYEDYAWQVSVHRKPTKKLGYEFVCDEEGK